jgi:hypothetical protein
VITSPIRPPVSTGTGHRCWRPARPPKDALRRFTLVRNHNASMASFRPALTEAHRRIQPPASRPVNSGPRPCLFDVGFPLSGPQVRTFTSDLKRHVRHTAADGDERLSAAYEALYAVARRTVGKEAHDAWTTDPITDDSKMNQGALYRRLEEFNAHRNAFAVDLRTATLPRPQRASRAIRTWWPRLATIPGIHPPAPEAPYALSPRRISLTSLRRPSNSQHNHHFAAQTARGYRARRSLQHRCAEQSRGGQARSLPSRRQADLGRPRRRQRARRGRAGGPISLPGRQ